MNADELQRWASILRWVGFSVTGIGVIITFASHYVADMLLAVQRVEKLVAQKRLTQSENELRANLEKTAELEKRLEPRHLSSEQRAAFVAALKDTPKGAVSIAYVSPQPESTEFVEEIRNILVSAGFTIPARPEYALSYTIAAPAPWFIAIIAGPGQAPPYALPIQKAFREIGIDAIGTDGRDIAQPGEVKIYVGAK